MSENTKDWLQYGSALVMLISGVVLTFICFFLNNHKIDDSVLWYMAQALVYAGSVFGVGIYIHTKFGEVRNEVKKMIDEGIKEKEDGTAA